jgi:hypothetical protein
MSVSEIIAIYEKLSPANQMRVREFVQQLITARKNEREEEIHPRGDTLPRPISQSNTDTA